MRHCFTFFVLLAVSASLAAAQKPMPMPMPHPNADSSPKPRPTTRMPRPDSMPGMNSSDSAKKPDTATRVRTTPHDSAGTVMKPTVPMSAAAMMAAPLGVSMDRMGSGTTWIPDAVGIPSRSRMVGGWMLMGHGFVFGQYDHQSGLRGGNQLGSLNWAMLMATHDLAGGKFQARTMLSLDALGVTSRGYPLLLQTGEAYNGVLLHDRQHPHDFWMELAALYQREINKSVAWSVYAAPSGEPALGPVAFMHRPSAMDNPTAPISHHWQDATHVSFGVATAGLFTRKFQLEGSVFNSRDPDQYRWDFDRIHIDSYSGRFTVNPNNEWSATAGYGYLKSHEAFDPKESMHRVTASILHSEKLGADGSVASALIWGMNKHASHPQHSNSVLAESEVILDRTNTIFGRAEWVQKTAEDLVVDNRSAPAVASGLPTFPTEQSFNVSAVEAGYIREIARTHWVTVGLGASGTLNFVPSELERNYGSRTSLGAMFFLRLRPFHQREMAAPTMRMEGSGRY